METLPIAKVIVLDNRIRKEFTPAHIKELAASILDKGLLHPIVLENDGVTLVCGERRLRAVTLLASEGKTIKYSHVYIDNEGQEHIVPQEYPLGEIPFTRMIDLPPDKRLEAELEENICRRDLSIQERSLAISQLHKLRISQYGDYDFTKNEGWSKEKTATEVKGRTARSADTREVSEALLIAENMDDPFVAAAKDKAQALRAVRDRNKLETRQRKVKDFDQSKTEHRLCQDDSFIHSFLVDGISYDIVVTDPPYGMELHETSMFDGQEHDYDDSNEMFQKILTELPSLLFSITKTQAHAYLFCDIRRFNELFTAFEIAGWTCWPRPLIWHKGNIGSYGAGEFGFRQTYDAILFANKGQKPLNSVYDEVIRINQPTNHNHPAGKPMELYAELLKRSSMPGDSVLDPFCGSGPIFLAAQKNHCIATGIEINPKYYEMAQETIMEMLK